MSVIYHLLMASKQVTCGRSNISNSITKMTQKIKITAVMFSCKIVAYTENHG